MEPETSTPEAPPVQEKPPKIRTTELTRASSGRMIAGVAEGISRRTGIWSGWIRAAFVLLAVAGGLGIAAYLAGWALIRADNEPTTIAERFFVRTTSMGSWIGVGLIFLAILILLDNVRFLSGGLIWAVGLLTVGFLLYTGDLPRLIKESSQPQEGAQPVKQPASTIEPASPEGGSDYVYTPPPPPPPQPTPTPPILPVEHSILGRLTFGVMLLALAVLAILDNTTSLVAPEPRHYVALGMTILGLGLLVGALAGRARWLIVVGTLAVPILVASPALEYNFGDWDRGTVYVSPTDFEQLPLTYSQGVGELVIDLTGLDWNGEAVSIDASLQIGELRIIVPEDIAVSGLAEGSIGQVEFDGDVSSGFNPDLLFEADGSAGVLELHASIGIGHLAIDRVSASG